MYQESQGLGIGGTGGGMCHGGMNKPLRFNVVTEATEALTQPPGGSTQGSS